MSQSAEKFIPTGIDADLDELRRVYQSLDHVLNKVIGYYNSAHMIQVGEEELSKYEHLDSLQIQYPHTRY